MSARSARLARGTVVAAAMMLGAELALPSGAGAATPPATSFSITRLAGADQYATAAAIATSSYAATSTAIVTTSVTPYDAGVANYVGGVLHAPILLTSLDAVPGATSAALQRLHASHVVVVGGELAVSADVAATLQHDGYTVTRIAGPDAIATAAAAATDLGAAAVGTTGGHEKTAIIASSTTPGDLNAIGPMAFAGHFPVLYANGTGLPTVTRDTLATLGVDHALVVGGPLAVPSSVEGALGSLGITSERIAGTNALETAARLANFEIAHLGFATNHVDIARGDDLADSLAGGPHAGLLPSPILVTANPTSLGGATATWLAHQCPSITTGHVFGGPLAVSDTVVAQVNEILSACGSATQDVVSPIVGGTVPSSGGTTPGGGGTTPTNGTPDALTLSPESAYPTSGTAISMTATVTANGAPVRGAHVDFFVVDSSTEGSQPTSGVCTLSDAAVPSSTGTSCVIDAADPVTDAAGHATFAFHWASPVGKRPIEGSWPQTVYAFTATEGTPFSLSSTGLVWSDAAITWVNAPSSVVLSPAASTIGYGATANVTATLESVNDEGENAPVPVSGETIHWGAYRDAAACTLTATTPPEGTPVASGSATTNADGSATISYAFDGTPPETDTTDCLFAYYDRNSDGVLQSEEPATTGSVTWSSAAATASAVTVTPDGASKLVGSPQDFAASVTDQYGAPVAGVTVEWSISRDGASLTSGSGLTNEAGEVTITDPSPEGSARDVVAATSGTLSGQATFSWAVPAASGSYAGVTVLNAEPTSSTSGTIDVDSGGTFLRLSYDTNDVLKVGSRTVQTERFAESLKPGATLTADPYAGETAGVSTFTIASSEGGGGHGGGGGGV